MSILDPVTTSKGLKYAGWQRLDCVTSPKAGGMGSRSEHVDGVREQVVCKDAVGKVGPKTGVRQMERSENRHSAYGQGLT